MSEVSLYGVRPTARFGARLSFLPQNGKDGRRCLAESAWSKQPKMGGRSRTKWFKFSKRPAKREFESSSLAICSYQRN